MAARTVDAGELRERVRRIFARLGLPEDDAAVVADHLVEADLRGVHSHGVIRVPSYVAGLKAGRINPRPQIRVVDDHGAQAVVDGDNGMGQLAAFRANDLAIERGREHGLAGVALRRSGHAGAMAYYPIRALRHGLIGFATTNAGINMPPTGGVQKLVGNNPFAIAVPTARDWPMVLDMATSVVAGGKLDVARAKGEPIPLGWARDAQGDPTTDPVAARQGSLEPLGGPKGYGMAVMLDVLAGVLSGGRFGAGLGAPGSGQFFLTLAVERYMPLEEFKARMEQLLDQLHACHRAPGVERIYVAGEIEWELQQRRTREGVPLEESVLGDLDRAEREPGG
ncbi:MAG TPA: Ldh family oxidoreductase [Chloroflexota bacterium]|jgi:LDH2 family malate/lactate/ureidoglycolate dehydrogenase|nr:Ldh family oxidoreductase [Chloroflexota bacterium]